MDEDFLLTERAIADSERAAGPSEADLADDEEPELGKSLLRDIEAEHRRVWIDSGSGPGWEVLAPRRRQRGEMPSDRG